MDKFTDAASDEVGHTLVMVRLRGFQVGNNSDQLVVCSLLLHCAS